MNAKEAKVPDVEGHWESIEIFLFSNGQQNTPPRKYHLRADELNAWDDTLNLLAQSHNGPQSPPINLYTIDGQLVEGPLELNNGLAYVAVTPPDTFIDAGYQKYLIRASRSWEKRQARKKIQECVTEDICCLCPEKEWCCDLQTCCLCPEREDEEVPESLHCATGHPELRPAGGHFMSSAPSKPAAADDYKLRSGKIAPMTCEYAVKPGECVYSPDISPVKPDECGARLVEYAANPNEHALRINENGPRLGEFRARPDGYGAIPGEFEVRPADNVSLVSKNGVRSIEHGTRLNENGARPGEIVASLSETGPRLNKDGARLKEYGTKPDENAAKPDEYETRPSVNITEPGENRAKPGEYKTLPNINGAKPNEFGVKPGKYETGPNINEPWTSLDVARPGEYETRITVNGPKPSDYKAGPDENETRSSTSIIKPYEYGAKSAEYETKLGVNGTKPSDYEARPGEDQTGLTANGAKPSEYKDKPGENGAKPIDYKAKLSENEIGSSVNGATPGVYKARLVENETRSGINGVKPNIYGAKPAEYVTKSGVNGAKSSEYETRLTVHGAKPSEYKTRMRENGTKSSEYKAKLDKNDAKPNDYKAKLSKNKNRSSINGAMLGEYKARPVENETRSSENGHKPNEYGAKLAEYETKPAVNGAKPSVFEAKPSEYETRLTVNGAKPSVYKARPGKNGAKPSEYKAKPGENENRPSVNSAKTGDYGARLGEYETKLSVNGARHSRNEVRQSLNIVKPSEYGDRRGKNESRPSVNRAMPGEHRARPGENEIRRSLNGAKTSEFAARMGEYETRPRINGAKSGEYRARSDELTSVEQRNQPNQYEPRSAEGGSWSGGIRQTVYEARPGKDGPVSNELESKKETYEIELHDSHRSLGDNVDRLDKHTVDKDAGEECKFRTQSSSLRPIGENELEMKGEYGATESDQRDKQIDPKDRASGNEGRDGARRVSAGEQSDRENDTLNGLSEPKSIEIENARRPIELRPLGIETKRRPSQQRGEIENTRRLSRQTGPELEQGDRTGKLTRAFELDDKVSEQKVRETNPAGTAEVNAAKLNGQRNKKSNHLATLGGRENRVGDHEARAGDRGLRTSNHEGELVNSGSATVADTSARAAVSGSRESPRDRMSSIARTSNLGQSNTAAKVGESEIKNRVGYLGARQNSVGGAGAAGASHISEAQQHARRTSISAGGALTEKNKLPIGKNSSLLRKSTPISSVIRKSEDKQPIKTNKEIFGRKLTGKASAFPDRVSNANGQSKPLRKNSFKLITPPAPPPPTSNTNLLNSATNKVSLENIVEEQEMAVVTTHFFREPESEVRSMTCDSVKLVVDVTKNCPDETQTELIYVEKNVAPVTVNEDVQTNSEAVEQYGQEVFASSKANINSCTCTCAHCSKRDQRFATEDPEANIISIQNKGDVINLKLDIEIRKIVRSVNSCQNNGLRSRSLTNISRSEKESQISIDDGIHVRQKSLLQLNHQYFQGYGFEDSPKVKVVQCAGCGKLNYPPWCDQPPRCDNNKQYFVFLANSVNEDVDECCNFNPPCRPCDLRQAQLKKSSCLPIKQTLSEMTLETITTVTVSGVPLPRREMVKKIDTACRIEESQGECMMTKRTESISKVSGTRCDFQKENNSLISVTTQVDTKHSCRKLCPQKCEHEDSRVYSEFCPPVTSYQKVQSVCSQVSSEACPLILTKQCQQPSLQVQLQGCKTVSPTYSPCCPKPLPCIQVQTQVCLQVPQVSDAQTQTQWNGIVARLHPDGRYSFHLPPLNVLNSYPF